MRTFAPRNGRRLRVAFVTAETEHCLVGGLAEVARSLPPKLMERGISVKRFCPLYQTVWSSASGGLVERQLRDTIKVRMEGEEIPVTAYRDTNANVPTYYIKDVPAIPRGINVNGKSLEEVFFQQQFNGGSISAQSIINACFSRFFYRGRVYPSGSDLGARFFFASKAVLELIRSGRFGKFDLIHFQDWHFAMIATLLRFDHRYDKLRNLATVGTVHNPFSWGVRPNRFEALSGLKRSAHPQLYGSEQGLLHEYEMHFLKGIQNADASNTVSPTYGRQLLTPKMGASFHGMFQFLHDQGVFGGILNGIDQRWNPATDPHIAQNYTAEKLKGKAESKRRLKKIYGLKPGDYPLITLISRITSQKGFDILIPLIEPLANQGVQFAISGVGEKKLTDALNTLSRANPRMIGFKTGAYKESDPPMIYAGGDSFIRASVYEPCGLSQMIAMKYGNVPIVHATGGLADTVFDIDHQSKTGNGFSFRDHTSPALLERIDRAIRIKRDHPGLWRTLQTRGMQTDFSWDKTVEEYLDLYERALANAATRTAA